MTVSSIIGARSSATRRRTALSNPTEPRLARLAGELGVPLMAGLRSGAAKVLCALSGERDVSTGYAAVESNPPLPCRLTTDPHSWRGVLLESRRAELELLSHEDFPVDDLR